MPATSVSRSDLTASRRPLEDGRRRFGKPLDEPDDRGLNAERIGQEQWKRLHGDFAAEIRQHRDKAKNEDVLAETKELALRLLLLHFCHSVHFTQVVHPVLLSSDTCNNCYSIRNVTRRQGWAKQFVVELERQIKVRSDGLKSG